METGAAGRWRRMGVGLAVGALGGGVLLDLDLPGLVFMDEDSWVCVLAGAIVGALLWLTPARRLVGWAVALLAVLWAAVAFTSLIVWLEDGLVRKDPLRAADLVYVFGASVQSNGDPTAEAMSRLLKGIELLAEGQAPLLVVPELPPPGGFGYLALARRWAETFAPRGRVLALEGPDVNTHDEALALARLCRERGWKRVLAVTSPLHTRRASATLERAGLEVISVPSIETRFDLAQPNSPGDRRPAFVPIVHERIGLLVYRHRGWIQ
jgi:uncharacterized SAM-binding protein YcdF (DUF218 family)